MAYIYPHYNQILIPAVGSSTVMATMWFIYSFAPGVSENKQQSL